MTKRKDELEILAPAGSPQALTAAVACGANAVYLGVGSFNARRGAENFTIETLAQTVRMCHIEGVRVYLTLNIVVLEAEMPAWIQVAQGACEAGVDAVIVQDLGAARLLHAAAPSLRLHASTQMAVHNAAGAKELETLGFSRVVLARECTADEIAAICAATSMEVEVFVHGALCMSVSGQCYMSSVFGQRSGNRGLCAQPCRLAFSSGKSGHALSLKDMSLLSHIGALRAAGVHSLKIEGRMKRPEYVAAAVSACRAAVLGETPDLTSLRAIFSRSGFTDGYFTGQRTLEMFGIREKEDVTAAAPVLGKLENLYTDPRKHVRRVGLEMAFSMKAGTAARLTVRDCDGNEAAAAGEIAQVALHKPTDEARVRQNLEKTGGTPYFIETLSCEIEDGLMMPVSSLNALRRQVFEQLDELRGAVREIPFDKAAVSAVPDEAKGPGVANRKEPGGLVQKMPAPPKKPALRVFAASADQITAAVQREAQLITLPAAELTRLCAGGAPACASRLCAGLPRMLFAGEATLLEQLGALKKCGITHAMAGNLGALRLAREQGFTVHAAPFFNIVNSFAASTLALLGAADICYSFELELEAAKRLRSKGPVPAGLTAYGALPLMTVRTCPVRVSAGCEACKKGADFITDRRGNRFHVSCAHGCSELYNPVVLYMGDRLSELGGLDFIELRFTAEDAEECARVFSLYQNGGALDKEYTRGLLYKKIQ